MNHRNSSAVLIVGNLDSLLFRQRLEKIKNSTSSSWIQVLDTGKSTWWRRLKFFLGSLRFILQIAVSARPYKLIFHGAYSPILWLATLRTTVRTISILQGSELNIDFHGWRAHIIRMILRHSELVICRNEAQVAVAVGIAGIDPDKCGIVHWGLDSVLFNTLRPSPSEKLVIISPRASQREYNIPLIFDVIRKLKGSGYPIHFIYVKFNATIQIDGLEIADECLDNPRQEIMWQALAKADICISVPDYDGLSNTVIESLALGTYPIISDLASYKFICDAEFLGKLVVIDDNYAMNVSRLYQAVEAAIANIGNIKMGVGGRRNYAKEKFEQGRGLERLYAEIDG